ncbi:hypothetical protein WH50_22570 [Pokkaliibacter plantistimulans]|uniref:Uncharacterized protein n=1 Tax=Pokkaliibacter plantistimulans TaxID=1635171 RepID=A0ABX5LU31_9GAMM|nr:hypothetical protein [Pokkaliibacter plantistimulans]PXF29105.1 hypothetical protein WH50_22570 [Pokkaliibacter plantistimulans]
MDTLNAEMTRALGGLTRRGSAAAVHQRHRSLRNELTTKHYERENYLSISHSMLALMLMNHPEPERLQQE